MEIALRSPTIDADRLQTILDDIVLEVRDRAPTIRKNADAAAERHGKPAPKAADFNHFGIAVFKQSGQMVRAGNSDMPFPIQSISKVFALEVALEALGERLWSRVGREPSGDAYNSIIDLERHRGIPRNPFINAGALVVVDALLGTTEGDPNRRVMDFVRHQLDTEKASFDKAVMASDQSAGDLNRSLMFMARHHGNLRHEVPEVMDAYVHQCAVTLDCAGLAKAGRFLMQDGPDERSERGLSAARRARRILAIMMMCGMYDGSGDFAYRVGLPAKSGVGGGILAVAPHAASIAVWSPALDPMGNSWLGALGLELLAKRTDWSVFGATKD